MTQAEDIRELEAMTPWNRADFRAGLAALTDSTAVMARRFAADLRILAGLAAQVPRCAGDERGSSPWTSFRREVAVARRVSDQAAAVEIRAAVRLTTVLPQTMDLLEAGRITVARANGFVAELEVLDDEIAGQLDTDLAPRAALVPRWRIAQDVRRAALRLEPEEASLRAATATAQRAVSLRAQPDGQASIFLTGPAVPLTRWYSTLDGQARALRQAGDPRTLDNLRFDLAISTFPCAVHSPADPTPTTAPLPGPCAGPDAAAGLRPAGVEAAPVDCRLTRPVQAMIVVPVETALGLSNDPAWLDGYGWIDAPLTRQLLVDAELRRVCAQTGTGAVVDIADQDVRPPPTPPGLRGALLDMVQTDPELSDVAVRREPQHDPSDLLRLLVTLRDRSCDGPIGSQVRSLRCELDHDTAYPIGPTAAWNLSARGTRTHQLKHYGWTPLRTPTSTVWTSPAGQIIEVPRHLTPPPGIDADPHGRPPALPDPDELRATDLDQLRAPTADDIPPWLPDAERPQETDWTWLDHVSEDVPF